MLISKNTIECKNGTAHQITFVFTPTELAMIQADQPDQKVKQSFSFMGKTEDGCYQPLRGNAITLAKANQFVQAFILQDVYEQHFGISIQAEIDDAIHNPDRE